MNQIIVPSLSDLPAAAFQVIQSIKDFKIIAVYGPLGVGKTTMIKEICKQMGVPDIVNSPTFALVNEYFTTEGKIIYHFDFYRINSIREAYDIGYEDFFFSGNICFIEWPEKVEELLTDDVLRIKMEETDSGSRVIRLFNDNKEAEK
jgi:tRNA threonylcarbamoyladenosine biosynthesis protein TsaE